MTGARRTWAWARAVPARTPLRVRLVAAVMLLVVAALVGSGIATTTIMRSYLVGRVDDQLIAVGEYPIEGVTTGDQTDPDGSGPGGHGPDDRHGSRTRLPSAFVVEVTDAAGKIVYGPSSDPVNVQDPLPRFPALSAAQSQAAGTDLSTVPAASGNESWRLLTKPVLLTNGSRGTLYVAQSLGDVGGTIQRMTTLLLIIGAVAVALLAGLGYLVVRVSLRPLRDMERTAAAIAGGDLAQRVPKTDSRTEVGQLSGALNTMLVEIETAFAQRAASEQAARRSEEHARQSEERMRRFVADASHELRTPLTSIRGFAELYRQGAVSDPAEVARLMKRIEDEAKRMGLLVGDLLLLARLDRERPLEQVPIDMLTLAGDAVAAARAAAPDRPIRLRVGPADPPPVVLGDDARLRQVLANLLSNAVRHTPAGTPVSVDLETRDTYGRPTLVLTVADDGPGMTADEAERIFERFYRADPSRRRDEGGTGLGLAIVAAIVAGHNGRVSVDTAPGRGARFRVELPLAEVRTLLPG